MFIQPLFFYGLLIVITGLGLALVILAILYAQALKNFYALKSQVYKKVESILEDARIKGVRIIEEANLKAQEIITKAHRFDESSNTRLEQELEKVSKNQAESLQEASFELSRVYKIALEELKNDNIKALTSITKDIEKDLLDELRNYKEILRQETLASQKIIEKKLEEEYAQVQSEINAYKEEQLKLVDESICKVLSRVSELTLGQAINFNTHEDLVIEALDKVKQDILKRR